MEGLKSALQIIGLLILTLILTACGGLQPGPDTAQKYHDQGMLDLTTLGRGGKPAQAVEYFSQAIQAEPNFAKSYNARGVAYVLLGEYDKARADFKKTLEIEPTDVQARENLNHLDAGEYDQVTAVEK